MTTPRSVMPTRRASRTPLTALPPAAPARDGGPPPRPGQFAAPVPAASASPSDLLPRPVLRRPPPTALPPAAPARDGVPPPRPGQFAAPVPAASASPSDVLRRRVLRRPPTDRSGGAPPSRGVDGRSWCAVAAAGPAPETGGGTEEVPKAGPGGGPPTDPRWIGSDGS